jgi:uncharacterized protein YoxC
MADDLIHEMLTRIEGKVDSLTTESATIKERVSNIRDQVQAHNLADAMTHKDFEDRITSVEHFRTSWRAKAASWAAGVAVAVTLVTSVVASAIAGIFKAG